MPPKTTEKKLSTKVVPVAAPTRPALVISDALRSPCVPPRTYVFFINEDSEIPTSPPTIASECSLIFNITLA